jgi:hypothetical protein
VEDRAEKKATWGRLNIFQKTMLHWNDLHPYNAAHVVCVPASLDLRRLENIIERVLAAQGFGEIHLSRNKGAYHYGGIAVQCDVRHVSDADGTFASLSEEVERQLNTPFPCGEAFLPFRFFVSAGKTFFRLAWFIFMPSRMRSRLCSW